MNQTPSKYPGGGLSPRPLTYLPWNEQKEKTSRTLMPTITRSSAKRQTSVDRQYWGNKEQRHWAIPFAASARLLWSHLIQRFLHRRRQKPLGMTPKPTQKSKPTLSPSLPLCLCMWKKRNSSTTSSPRKSCRNLSISRTCSRSRSSLGPEK